MKYDIGQLTDESGALTQESNKIDRILNTDDREQRAFPRILLLQGDLNLLNMRHTETRSENVHG